MKQEEGIKFDKYERVLFISGFAFATATIVIALFFQPSIDYSGVPPNATGQPTKIAAQTVPTIVNGITTVIAITIAFGAAVVGITFRHVLTDRPEDRSTYFVTLGGFIFPVCFLWGSYLFLAYGWLDYAVKYSFTALLVALFTFIFVYLYAAKRFNPDYETSEKLHEKNPEETEQEKLKREFQHRRL